MPTPRKILRRRARRLAADIAAFDEACADIEYTDLNEAWELLFEARDLLQELGAVQLPLRHRTGPAGNILRARGYHGLCRRPVAGG